MRAVAQKKTYPAIFKPAIIKSKSEPSPPTIDEHNYWDQYYQHEINYEWNNGILEEKLVSDYATVLIYHWLMKLFGHYIETHHTIQMTHLEMGFRLNLGHKVCIRKPDLGIVCQHNPVQLSPKDRSYQGIFDICVEAVSDSKPQEVIKDTVIKKQEYAQAGVKEYYLVYDKGCDAVRGIELYRLENGVYQSVKKTAEGLLQSTVLKGFQFRFDDCYHQPEAKEMCLDPVYQAFVFPEYQLEKTRADAAEQQTTLEKTRAEAEKTRADTAEQKLLSLQATLT
jgi:hypothetical protein